MTEYYKVIEDQRCKIKILIPSDECSSSDDWTDFHQFCAQLWVNDCLKVKQKRKPKRKQNSQIRHEEQDTADLLRKSYGGLFDQGSAF